MQSIFGEIDVWRLLVNSASKPRILTCAFLLQSEEILTRRSLRRFVRMRCLCACGVFVHWSRPRSCHSRVPRALFMCVHVCGAVSCELCVCVFFACGGLTSVEHWACPRLWRVGRGSVFVFARVFLIWFLFVGGVCGGCSWWRL